MNPKLMAKNTLFYGDNLPILREHIADESVDLVYLDPPFNSNRSYNVLFKEESGKASESQLAAFDDAWRWGETAESEFYDLTVHAPLAISKMIATTAAITMEMMIDVVSRERVLSPPKMEVIISETPFHCTAEGKPNWPPSGAMTLWTWLGSSLACSGL